MKILAKHLYPDAYQEYEEQIIDRALEISREEIRTGKVQEFSDCLVDVKAKINAL